MIWSKIKLVFFKLKIEMIKIFELEKEYKIDIRVRLKPDKIGKILTWPVPQDQIAVRVFFGTI